MDKMALFQHLSSQDTATLLALLDKAYDQMDHDQRQWVFGKLVEAVPPSAVEGESLLVAVEFFQQQSLAGAYYAPFNMNSKNFSHIPTETETWFEKLTDFLNAATQLTQQGEHLHAATCFDILFNLIDRMEYGDEIVFAEEIGSWMILGDEKEYVAAYMTSLAATTAPEEFVTAAIPLIKRDSYHSFFTQAYQAASRVSNAAQKKALEAEIQHKKIRTDK